MKDLKYLAAFSIPLVTLIGLNLKGNWLLLTPIYTFIILPLLELIAPINSTNLNTKETKAKLKNSLFDWLLYLNLPIVYGLLGYGIYITLNYSLSAANLIFLVVSTGVVLGVNGINVGHELGHRQQNNERFLGKALLLPSLYMHFYIEHNFGHHLHVATKEDPATARYNQAVYSFWVTSTIKQYINAWRIQKTLLKRKELSFFSIKNDMFWYALIQITYLLSVFIVFGTVSLLFIIGAAIIGFLLLETVNYIEHYGLLRLKTKHGRYERVKEIHSWNSNHTLGRIVLYALTRHSDHHYKASKKYQVLNCHEESPQLPFGYPTSMVISLVPPLWFAIMNKRVPKEMII